LCGNCGICLFDSETQKKNHKKFCEISRPTQQVALFSDNRVACTLCGVGVEPFYHHITTHLSSFHPEIQKKCPQCEAILYCERALYDHKRNMHSGKEFQCDICEKVCNTKSQLNFHRKSAHDPNRPRHQCDECPNSFTTAKALRYHKEGHAGTRRPKEKVVCAHCGGTYDKKQYIHHLRRKHGEERIECQICQTVFKHHKTYELHVKEVHAPAEVTCDHCGKQFNPKRFKHHMRVAHTPDHLKRHVCGICGKGFQSKASHRDHMNVHSGERPHACLFCPKTFKDSNNRNKHYREAHPDEYLKLKLKNKEKSG